MKKIFLIALIGLFGATVNAGEVTATSGSSSTNCCQTCMVNNTNYAATHGACKTAKFPGKEFSRVPSGKGKNKKGTSSKAHGA